MAAFFAYKPRLTREAMTKIRPLKWSKNAAGNHNGKVGPYTLMTVCWQDGRGWFVSPKLPGLKTVDVASLIQGQYKAERMYQKFMTTITEG
jgi:hypothetical protein